MCSTLDPTFSGNIKVFSHDRLRQKNILSCLLTRKKEYICVKDFLLSLNINYFSGNTALEKTTGIGRDSNLPLFVSRAALQIIRIVDFAGVQTFQQLIKYVL